MLPWTGAVPPFLNLLRLLYVLFAADLVIELDIQVVLVGHIENLQLYVRVIVD
jgi:hypothetical protein